MPHILSLIDFQRKAQTLESITRKRKLKELDFFKVCYRMRRLFKNGNLYCTDQNFDDPSLVWLGNPDSGGGISLFWF